MSDKTNTTTPPSSPSTSITTNAAKDWHPQPKTGPEILNDRFTKTPFNPGSIKK